MILIQLWGQVNLCQSKIMFFSPNDNQKKNTLFSSLVIFEWYLSFFHFCWVVEKSFLEAEIIFTVVEELNWSLVSEALSSFIFQPQNLNKQGGHCLLIDHWKALLWNWTKSLFKLLFSHAWQKKETKEMVERSTISMDWCPFLFVLFVFHSLNETVSVRVGGTLSHKKGQTKIEKDRVFLDWQKNSEGSKIVANHSVNQPYNAVWGLMLFPTCLTSQPSSSYEGISFLVGGVLIQHINAKRHEINSCFTCLWKRRWA